MLSSSTIPHLVQIWVPREGSVSISVPAHVGHFVADILRPARAAEEVQL